VRGFWELTLRIKSEGTLGVDPEGALGANLEGVVGDNPKALFVWEDGLKGGCEDEFMCICVDRYMFFWVNLEGKVNGFEDEFCEC